MTCCARMRRQSLGAEVDDLREDWMAHADQVLADEALVAAVYAALSAAESPVRRALPSSLSAWA
jgi:hypothetical protein